VEAKSSGLWEINYEKGHVEAMKGKYFHDVSIVRIGGENIVPLPEKNEVVVFRSFMKAELRFPCRKRVTPKRG
jgi:hypothetical protein